MLFNSLEFLFFLIIVFAVYWSVPSRLLTIRNAIIVVASYVFYGYWDWRFLILIAISTIVDYIAGLKIHQTKTSRIKKLWLSLSIIVNIGMLGFFKYFNFFVDSFASLLNAFGLHANVLTLNIVLPVGISFYTFQTLSYTIDVYREKITPTHKLLNFAAFVAFFPQLVAGPIERAANLLPQFSHGKIFNHIQAKLGAMLMVYGFFKKIAVADNIALLIDPVYANPADYHNYEVLLAMIGFGFQAYADFSGYSDIAIGLAALFGFHLNTNFRTPFVSKSIREFWTRWHISLYSWFRDYIYIPLGGSRGTKTRLAINVLITFGLSGLWHGAGFNYIFFGLLHGSYYLVEKSYINRIRPWAVHLISLVLITLAWAVFRTNSYADWVLVTNNLWTFSIISPLELNTTFFIMAATMIVFLTLEHFIKHSENFAVWIGKKPFGLRLGLLYLVVFWTLLFGAFNSGQNFMYFQF